MAGYVACGNGECKMERALRRIPLILPLILLCGFAPQKSYSECIEDPEALLAMSFEDFDQGVRPDGDGPRQEWGWRPLARQEGCYTAVAVLLSQWRERNGANLHPFHQGALLLHEGQLRAGGGDYAAAISLIEERRAMESDAAGKAYFDAMIAFLRSDREALLAARERLLAVPEPPNWSETQRLFREQAGQEMTWPINIEATDTLVRCFGKPYPVFGEC
ncbi:hypothetical protein [Alteraurantiacibacter aquimixticola]|uniref:Uncharacterized protein n=1 Tax=Alteraurantiacibacter aquimixticola TaxID=2489173 RepID=A0A4T3F188_9SPHN|nr:hypothetical protein [Alteraurantiacibacter aquimixticola]TIX50035.1 hypothetical protein E5222_06965 [Alteraurantiacibacter aquimixticola]